VTFRLGSTAAFPLFSLTAGVAKTYRQRTTVNHEKATPTVGTFAGFIVEPIDVLTMDIHIPMEDILRIPIEDILLTPMEAMEWAME